MKKIYIFTLMAFAFVTVAQAQTKVGKKFSWGYKIGLNASNLRVEEGNNTKWKTGLATGLFFTIKLNEKLSVQPETLYSSMGAKNANDEGSLRLNYFSLPVMVKYKICKGFAAMAGPQIDVMIQAKTKSSSNSFTKVTNSYKENSFNATGGFEWWPVHCLGLSGRYIYGLSNIAISGADVKNQGVQFTAAIKL